MQPTPVYGFPSLTLIIGGLVCLAVLVGLVIVIAIASQKRGRRD